MVYNTSNSKWGYQYDLKDHLGNTRVSFSADNAAVKPLQYKDYYPFGMEMANWYATDVDATKYLYNGKELQDEGGLNWYDYGARFYDPAIGRWHTPDPLCEVNRKWSPYRYAYNNPLRFIDPDGKKIVNPNHYVLSNKKFIAEMKNFDLAVARLSGKETEAFTMTVSGGDRYKKGDKIFSRTNDSEIKNSASKSKHLQSEGAIAVDLATTDISYEILNKAAKESGFRIDPSGSYDDGHFHIDLKDSKYKDEYLKDESIDHNYIPSNEDFEHNKTDNSNKKETKKDNENWQTDNTAKQDATRVSNPWVLINSWLQQNPNINLTIR
jgi:RHS repeat-associated protein